MKIVFASSEASPFIKTGGLGDVSEALPSALAERGENDVYVFLPYYKAVKENGNIKVEFVTSFSVNLSWRIQHVGLFKATECDNKTVYFIDNEYYFYRDGIYGFADDGERFAYFSKAVTESLLKLSVCPDIIHCNDWQTALIPVFLHAFYHNTLGSAKTVFTIHNIEYQGKCDKSFLFDVLGLDLSYESMLLFDNRINFMKGAILSSDVVTTVSYTYAKELCYPYYAHGLADIISYHSFKFYGVTNGINQTVYNPATDKSVYKNYNSRSFISGKAYNKERLQAELGLNVNKDTALIGIVTRLVPHKGLDLLASVIYELMNWNIELVILGTGEKRYEDLFKRCSEMHPDKLSLNLKFDSGLASKIYAASDLYLMPSKSEPCGLSQLIAMRYGAVPVVNATGGLKDTVEPFNPENGTGTGFNFQSFNADDMLDGIRRALTVYGGNRGLFNKIIRNGMRRNSSWSIPASEYTDIYKSVKKIESEG